MTSSLFFSSAEHSGDEDWITELVKQASVSDREIGNMKEAYDILISYNNNKMALSGSVENLLKSNEEAKKLYYTRAVAYQMLLGGGGAGSAPAAPTLSAPPPGALCSCTMAAELLKAAAEQRA